MRHSILNTVVNVIKKINVFADLHQLMTCFDINTQNFETRYGAFAADHDHFTVYALHDYHALRFIYS